jgi:1-acyl-sn-glycerol-3-phosphate acyltransferase
MGRWAARLDDQLRLMGQLRVGVRLLAIGMWTMWIALDLTAGALAAKVWPSFGLPWYRAVPGRWSRVCLWISGVSVEAHGTPPSRPFFLVSNHLSYVDIWVLHSQVVGCFLAKQEVSSWPGIGLLARGAGTVFVDREARRDVMRAGSVLGDTLQRGDGVIVFPEGTSTDGTDIQPFKASLFQVAVDAGLAVRTASLHYATTSGDEPASQVVSWWGDMSFGPHVLRFMRLKHVVATVRFQEAALKNTDRKVLAECARQAILADWIPQAPA